MNDAQTYISDIISTCMNVASNRGEFIGMLPFIIPSDGYVYDDSIVRIVCSVDAAFIEVYRKSSESIVFDLGNAVLRIYSPDMDLLTPHLHSLLTTI